MNSFIPNTGLQFLKKSWVIDDFDMKFSINYTERFSDESFDYLIDEVIKYKNSWYSLSEIYASDLENIQTLDDEMLTKLNPVSENEIKKIGASIGLLRKFEKNWIPIPMVKKNHLDTDAYINNSFVPRVYYELNDNKIDMVFALNTDVIKDLRANEVRKYEIGSNSFQVNQLLNSDLSSDYDTSWVSDYLGIIYSKNNPEALAESEGAYIASYILLLKTLKLVANHVEIQFELNNIQEITVNSFIDIGNTSTSVSLQEMGLNSAVAEFNKLKKLSIFEFENPLKTSSQPFSTTAVFHKPMFTSYDYEIPSNDKMFYWKSPLRLGREAERLLSYVSMKYASNLRPVGLSSPKRYLWDTNPNPYEWVFCNTASNQIVQPVQWEGVTTKLTSSGELCDVNGSTGMSTFSRSSINTFVFLEILSHLYSQINSVEFRESHGNSL